MRTLALAVAATSMLAAVPALAEKGGNGNGNAYGHDPKVCLLTFDGTFGADADVVKAQYLPLRIAERKVTDETTQGIAYYGPGELDPRPASVDFYYPEGSSSAVIGVNETSDTETLCEAFADYAESQDDDDDSDD